MVDSDDSKGTIKSAILKSLLLVSVTLAVLLSVIGLFVLNPVIDQAPEKQIKASDVQLKQTVQFLTDIQPVRNYFNLESLNTAATYIETQFQTYCPQVRVQTYEASGVKFKNIICFFPGESRKRIVIGAHYDVCRDQPGADDNASGVAGIVEVARLLKEKKIKPKHDLEIVAYSLEEPPFFRTENMGSFHHAQSLSEANIDVQFMLSVEMIGYFSDEPWSQDFPSPMLYLFYPHRGNFMALVSGTKEFFRIRKAKSIMSGAMETPLYSLSAPADIPGLDFSDHLNYWKFGYDGYMITDTSFYRNKNYHQPTDTIDTLNFEKMADVVSGIFHLAISSF